jgi:hypothetical protein
MSTNTNVAVIPFQDVERMAVAMAKSNLFGVKTPEQALSLMLLSQAQGIHPAQAVQDYHLIQGKPALTTNAILSRFQMSGGKVEYHQYTDAICEATFSHPQGGSLRLSWTFPQAQKAGLTNKDNWKQYPRAMLRSRVVAEGIRAVFPQVLGGMYSQEEVQDFDARPVPMKDITPEPTPAEAKDKLDTFLMAMNDAPSMELLSQQYTVAKMAFRTDTEALRQIVAAKDAAKDRIGRAMVQDVEDV